MSYTVTGSPRNKQHRYRASVRDTDAYRTLAADILKAHPPKSQTEYGQQPGVSRTGYSRAIHGDPSNFLFRALCHFHAMHAIGESPDAADLIIHTLRLERRRLWGNSSRTLAETETREAEADTAEDRLYTAFKLNLITKSEYVAALREQLVATEQRIVALQTL